jgi:hypothetical protein
MYSVTELKLHFVHCIFTFQDVVKKGMGAKKHLRYPDDSNASAEQHRSPEAAKAAAVWQSQTSALIRNLSSPPTSPHLCSTPNIKEKVLDEETRLVKVRIGVALL